MAAGKDPKLSRRDRRRIGDAVVAAEESTGLEFCVYLGATGDDPHATAERMFVEAGLTTHPAVLLLVAVDHHRVEILTAPAIVERLPDEECAQAIEVMRPRLAEGRLAEGLVAGIAYLAKAAGRGERGAGPRLPDVLGG